VCGAAGACVAIGADVVIDAGASDPVGLAAGTRKPLGAFGFAVAARRFMTDCATAAGDFDAPTLADLLGAALVAVALAGFFRGLVRAGVVVRGAFMPSLAAAAFFLASLAAFLVCLATLRACFRRALARRTCCLAAAANAVDFSASALRRCTAADFFARADDARFVVTM
jgi:hypothetical protein